MTGVQTCAFRSSVSESFDQTYSGAYEGPEPVWIMILSVAILAPVCEEVIFRGIGCSRIRSAFPHVVTVLVTSLIFGTAHGTPIAIAYATAFGVVQAVIFLKHRSLLPVVLCHFAFNLSGVLSENTYGNPALNIALFLISICVSAACMFYVLKGCDAKTNGGYNNASL